MVKGKIYVGRSPHEGFFTPDGKKLWVVVRGEDYVSVIDPVQLKEIRRIHTANGPGMVQFRPDGKYAFVPSSFTPEMDVVDMATYAVVARVPQASPFSPNLAVDQDEVWFTLKDSGKTQVVCAKEPFPVLATLETGPITNHVTFVDNSGWAFRLHFCRWKGRGARLYPRYRRRHQMRCNDQDRRSSPWRLGIGGWKSRLRWLGERRRCSGH